MSRRPSPFARSSPVAVALLVVLAALSARDGSPGDGASWPAAGPVVEEGGVAAGAAAPAAPAVLVRAAGGDVVEREPAFAGGAEPGVPEGIGVEDYPHPVDYLTVDVAGAAVPLAFMDVPPTGPVNGRTVLLLHDRDGAGDGWEPTISVLAADGYRVLVPDQVGHGLSGRTAGELPAATLAAQAAVLLDSLGAPRVSVVGDGLGAEVAVRLAAGHAGLVDRLVLIPAAGAAPEEGRAPFDPVRGRRVPVLLAADDERLDALLLGFLGL